MRINAHGVPVITTIRDDLFLALTEAEMEWIFDDSEYGPEPSFYAVIEYDSDVTLELDIFGPYSFSVFESESGNLVLTSDWMFKTKDAVLNYLSNNPLLTEIQYE